MNGVNLSLFQFDYDLTWMAFFMDAKDQFYARYGGRGESDPESHLSKKSLLAVMRRVLSVHKSGDVQAVSARVSVEPRRIPEDIPTMKKMMASRKENKCIHCHDVKVAQLRHQQALGTFTREMIYQYPTAAALGIQLDRDLQTQVRSVAADSSAARAGVKPGDILRLAGGQRVLTFGDISRVLETTPESGALAVQVQRAEETLEMQLSLVAGWRKGEDPGWRESTHVAGPGGGFWGRKLDETQRAQAGLSTDALALRVTYIWAPHAKQAGLKLKDIVVALDGRRNDMSIKQMHGYLHMNKDYGEEISLRVKRGDQQIELTMKLPTAPPAS